MKKVFEFILMVIIFYGVYTAFSHAAPVVIENPKDIWVGVVALLASAALLLLYSSLVGSEVKQKMKKDLHKLQTQIVEKEALITEKEEQVKKAQSFKEDLIKEAEASVFIEK